MTAAYPTLALFVDGEWIERTDAAVTVIDPATGGTLGALPAAGPAELDRALDAAWQAFPPWRDTPAGARLAILRKAGELIRNRAPDIARILTLEQGKPLAQARAEIDGAADFLDWIGEEGRRVYGRIVPSRSPGVRQMVVREPVGPVAAFTPWNFPATATIRKIGPALASGCSCIIKPSEETPATCIAIARALDDAGLPKGVLNLVAGDPNAISRRLIASPVIRKVSFTGSIPVGKHLARLAADGMKRVTMELGGHAPAIICDDADIDEAVRQLAPYKYRNAGQVCVSPTRFYVQRAVHRDFAGRFAEAAAALRVGSGLEAGTDMGPLANSRRREAMEALVADAVGRGAVLRTGGRRLGGPGNGGFFFAPTVLDEVPRDARAMVEEPFGPLALISPFDTLDEALEQANRLPFGLAAYAFTRSLERSARLGRGIEAGMVAINNIVVNANELPFGGVKESGYGSEAGAEGIEPYLVTKMISEMSH